MSKLFVVGNPIKHSKSPIIHNYWLNKYSIKCTYETKKIDASDLPNLVNSVRKGVIKGFNVTIPFKQVISEIVDEIDQKAKTSNAINTVYRKGDKVIGTNTDGLGFVSSLQKDLKYPLSPRSNIFCIGAGGAAYGIISEILKYKPNLIVITNRTESASIKLIKHFSQFSLLKKDIFMLQEWGVFPNKDIDLLINTSSCGMKTTDKLPIKLDHLPPKSLVYDIIYNPRETILMKEAKLYGLKNYNGLFMLIRQAAQSFHKWFNIDLTNEDILNAINLLKNHD